MGWQHILVLHKCLRDPFQWDKVMPTGMCLIQLTTATTHTSRLSSRRPSKLRLWETSSIHWHLAMGKLEKRVRRSIFWIQCVSSSDLLHDRVLLQEFARGCCHLVWCSISLHVAQHGAVWPLHFHVNIISLLVFHFISYEFIQKVQTVANSMEIITSSMKRKTNKEKKRKKPPRSHPLSWSLTRCSAFRLVCSNPVWFLLSCLFWCQL